MSDRVFFLYIFSSPHLLLPLSSSVIPPFPVVPSARLGVKVWWRFDNQELLKTDHISPSIHRLAGMLMGDGWVGRMLQCRARFTLMCLAMFFTVNHRTFKTEQCSVQFFNHSESTLKSDITIVPSFRIWRILLVKFEFSIWLFWHQNVTLTDRFEKDNR